MSEEDTGVRATAAELADLRARVRALEDAREIRELRNRFHDHVNTDRWDEIGALFAEDATLDYSYLGSASGREAIGRFFGSIPQLLPGPDGTPFVRQFIHGHTVEVDGDAATGTSSLFATPVYDGRSFVLAGRFTDTYVRRGGRWLFGSVRLAIDYSVPLAEGWARADRHHMRL